MTLDEAKNILMTRAERSDTDDDMIAFEIVIAALRAAESQVARLNANQVAYDVRCPNCSSSMVRDTAQSGGAEAMREAATEVIRKALVESGAGPLPSALTFANAVEARIRSLPVPPARTFEDGVRQGITDALHAARAKASIWQNTIESPAATSVVAAVDALLSPAPAVAQTTRPMTRSEAKAADAVLALLSPASAPTPGPTTPDSEDADVSLVREYPVRKPPFDAEAALETALLVMRDRYPRAGSVVESIHVITMLDEALAAGRRGTR